jgi:3,4-dihydroxy 2-butanone 4-phosphate synthase / GTP cyclohydrolase II
MNIDFDPIKEVLDELREGRLVIVTDDANRENEGDLILAAEKATPELINFMIRYTSGVICVPMEGKDLDRLELPLMTVRNTESMRTAYTVSVDAKEGVTTGISAADRSRTIRLLADPATAAQDMVRPGHVFPLRYREGGVLRRAGHTEAAVDLARLAGLRPAGVLAEVVNEDGSMARLPDLIQFKQKHGLKICSIESLIAYRRAREILIER